MGEILMPKKPEKPVIHNKIITGTLHEIFEDELDDFLKDLDSYSIQYKPLVVRGDEVMHCVLVTYHEPKGEKND